MKDNYRICLTVVLIRAFISFDKRAPLGTPLMVAVMVSRLKSWRFETQLLLRFRLTLTTQRSKMEK